MWSGRLLEELSHIYKKEILSLFRAMECLDFQPAAPAPVMEGIRAQGTHS